jgi:hypothetical protein
VAKHQRWTPYALQFGREDGRRSEVSSVAVYPRLGALLRARDLTVDELGRQIAQRFGLVVDTKSLDQWAHGAPVRQADLELAGAIGAVLDVRLADLFDVNAIPDLPEEESLLDEADEERLSELLDLQQSRQLSEDEATALARLVAEWGRRAREQGLQKTAALRGISIEQARRQLEADLDEARQWWLAFQSDPARRRKVIAKLRRRNRGTSSPT